MQTFDRYTIIPFLIGLGVLTGVTAYLWSGYLNGRETRRLMACQSQLKTVATVLDEYQQKNAAYPSKLSTLVPDYLQSLPTCPGEGEMTYTLLDNEEAFIQFRLACHGRAHERYMKENYPQYSSLEGLIQESREH